MGKAPANPASYDRGGGGNAAYRPPCPGPPPGHSPKLSAREQRRKQLPFYRVKLGGADQSRCVGNMASLTTATIDKPGKAGAPVCERKSPSLSGCSVWTRRVQAAGRTRGRGQRATSRVNQPGYLVAVREKGPRKPAAKPGGVLPAGGPGRLPTIGAAKHPFFCGQIRRSYHAVPTVVANSLDPPPPRPAAAPGISQEMTRPWLSAPRASTRVSTVAWIGTTGTWAAIASGPGCQHHGDVERRAGRLPASIDGGPGCQHHGHRPG